MPDAGPLHLVLISETWIGCFLSGNQEGRAADRQRDKRPVSTAPLTRFMDKDQAHALLEDMIDALGDAGVDVSYFPPAARAVLDEYAAKIALDNPNIRN